MQRRSFLVQGVAVGAAAASGSAGAAARAAGTRRLAVLLYDGPAVWKQLQDELQKELPPLGWAEGKNLVVDWRFANADATLLRTLAAELVSSRPDAILTRGTPATLALQRATSSIPILTGVGDPLGSGFAKSLAAPGGNITGVSWATVETSIKHVELLRMLLPRLATLRLVVPTDRLPFLTEITRPLETAARNAALATRVRPAATLAELKSAFEGGRPAGDTAAFVFAIAQIDPKTIADLALAADMPTMFVERDFVEAGGLASYKLYWDNQTRRAAAQIDKVLRGEKPASIPFELPTRSELALNKATARAIGVTIPQSLLLRADAVFG